MNDISDILAFDPAIHYPLNIREYFAIRCLQAIISDKDHQRDYLTGLGDIHERMARTALIYADALIKVLNEGKQDGKA